MALKIAIIGKPNVGKSTLFNRLCGRRLAITHDRPGVTRDTKSATSKFKHFEVEFIDTAGLDTSRNELTQKMFSSSLNSAKNADLILFVVDGRRGIDADDITFANAMRKLSKPLILLVNKAENPRVIDLNSIYKLGFEHTLFVSAEHNMGFDQLEPTIMKLCPELTSPLPTQDEDEDGNEEEQEEVIPLSHTHSSIKLAIIGRPNVGKSTMFNKLLGFERSIVSDLSGTTRDAINHVLHYKDHEIELIDTAGLRRKTAITDEVEQLSTVESINAIRRAHVVVLAIDGTCPLEKQDLSILRVAINEGRGVLLVINKCDLLQDHKAYKRDIEDYIEHKLFELKGLPILYVSALNDKNLHKVLDRMLDVMVAFNKRIATGALNRVLDHVTSAHVAPLSSSGRRIRLKYITQNASRPPTFTIFGNMVSQLPESYIRYVYNSIREAFKLYGVPIRVRCRSGHNPFNE